MCGPYLSEMNECQGVFQKGGMFSRDFPDFDVYMDSLPEKEKGYALLGFELRPRKQKCLYIISAEASHKGPQAKPISV